MTMSKFSTQIAWWSPSRLVSYPTIWSFSFILGPLHRSSIFPTSKQLCAPSRPTWPPPLLWFCSPTPTSPLDNVLAPLRQWLSTIIMPHMRYMSGLVAKMSKRFWGWWSPRWGWSCPAQWEPPPGCWLLPDTAPQRILHNFDTWVIGNH